MMECVNRRLEVFDCHGISGSSLKEGFDQMMLSFHILGVFMLTPKDHNIVVQNKIMFSFFAHDDSCIDSLIHELKNDPSTTITRELKQEMVTSLKKMAGRLY